MRLRLLLVLLLLPRLFLPSVLLLLLLLLGLMLLREVRDAPSDGALSLLLSWCFRRAHLFRYFRGILLLIPCLDIGLISAWLRLFRVVVFSSRVAFVFLACRLHTMPIVALLVVAHYAFDPVATALHCPVLLFPAVRCCTRLLLLLL